MVPPATADQTPAGAKRKVASAAAQSRTTRADTASQATASDDWSAEMEDLARAFKRLFRNVRSLRGRDTHSSGADVTHAQFELLIELYERGPLSAGELAAAAQLTPATVTQMLDHLAAGGHVERTRSEQDRRIVVTRLTALGKRKVNAKRALWHRRWHEALADMDPQELMLATGVLERLGAMFDETPDGGD
jgi:DNA-binding MarR family transcriptional regulator